MDYFFDKLSDRINASQDRGSGRDYEQGSQTQAGAPALDNSELEKIIDERLSQFKDQIVEEVKSGVKDSVNDSNSMFVEMISRNNDEGNTARLSATEEIMAALASTKNDISDAISMSGHATKEELTEIISRLQDEYLTRDDLVEAVAEKLSASEEIMAALASTKNDLADSINSSNYAVQESLTEIIAKQQMQQAQLSADEISDIADEVAHRVRQDQPAPVSEEGIAEAVAAALAVSLAAPASKEEIAEEVAGTLAATLDSHKLEISDIADAVAEKVREDQAVPVSGEEIARIVAGQIQENKEIPVSKEDIAQIVDEKIRENKETPISKEDIAAAVAADLGVTLAAQKLEISEIAEAVAAKVRESQAVPVSREEIARILAEKIQESKETPVTKEDIAQIVDEKIRENKETPVSAEDIAQIVDEKIRENKETPVSKEDIAAAVAADLGVTLAAQKLEISDIADAVAVKVRENQAVPLSKEEVAQIVAEKIQENKEVPVSKEEIAQIVAGKIQENKETPVSKEEIVSSVENVVSAKLSAMPHISKSDIITAMTVAWASNKTDITDSISQGFEKSDAGVARAVSESGADVKQELNENINNSVTELSDHVHKECVKVYKNVQAVLEESFQKQKEEIDAGASSREQNLKDIVDVSINSALRDNLKNEGDNTRSIVNDTVSSLLNTNTGEKLSTIKNMMLAIICMLGINLLGIIVIILWIFQVI